MLDVIIKTQFLLAQRNAVGQDLFNKVCEHLDLLERDYYGLVMWDSPSTRVFISFYITLAYRDSLIFNHLTNKN